MTAFLNFRDKSAKCENLQMENRLREPKVVAAAGYLLKSLPQR
jgi:hypothetical protein